MTSIPAASPPVSADFGLVVAMEMEVGPLLDQLSKVRRYKANKVTVIEGEFAGKIVAVVITGMGRPRAQRGAEALIDGHRPGWLISPGFGGALDPALRRNEIVLADDVANVEGRHFPIDTRIANASLGGGFRPGRLLTADAIARTSTEKSALREKFDAHIVDMETSAVAALCAERSVRFLSIRVVSDEAEIDLPPEILTIMGETGSVRLGAAIGSIWKRPGAIKDLLKLRENAMESAERLSAFLAEVIKNL